VLFHVGALSRGRLARPLKADFDAISRGCALSGYVGKTFEGRF
jgi:hypothetical protein